LAFWLDEERSSHFEERKKLLRVSRETVISRLGWQISKSFLLLFFKKADSSFR
jgi:hypothetical protein